MKKLITLITVISLLTSGAVVAQDQVPIRARDGSSSAGYGVPVRLRDNQDIQECIAQFEEVRGVLTEELKMLRERLAGAAPEDQAKIKEEIRKQLRVYLDEQREFKKNLRGTVREMRKERMGKSSGEGG